MVTRIPIVAVIIERNTLILMHRRNYEPQKGKVDFVGGFVERGETVEEAAVREVKEETGFEVTLTKKLAVLDYFQEQEKTMHLFTAKIVGGKERNSAEGEAVWIRSDERRELAFPHTAYLLDRYGQSKKGL